MIRGSFFTHRGAIANLECSPPKTKVSRPPAKPKASLLSPIPSLPGKTSAGLESKADGFPSLTSLSSGLQSISGTPRLLVCTCSEVSLREQGYCTCALARVTEAAERATTMVAQGIRIPGASYASSLPAPSLILVPLPRSGSSIESESISVNGTATAARQVRFCTRY